MSVRAAAGERLNYMQTRTNPTPFGRVNVVDSHTEGEPTRVVIEGGPELGSGTIADKLAIFRTHFDSFRSAIVNEPRGNDAMVGALVLPPVKSTSACGVIFFNNVGVLNSCGHGTIGLAVTLAHLGKIGAGRHTIETPVGDVVALLSEDGSVCLENVASFLHAAGIEISIQFEGMSHVIRGDIAWGGNWFFLTETNLVPVLPGNIERLTSLAWTIRKALDNSNITGARGQHIDHIEIFGAATRPDCDSKNFVLCPGKAYDRSPCGTGTSAKLACLHAAGKLELGQKWRQESIIGSAFTGWLRKDGNALIPSICGHAYICGESTLLLDPADPFVNGIRM